MSIQYTVGVQHEHGLCSAVLSPEPETAGLRGLQWGPLEFHKKSLVNLGEAMRRTRKLCAVMVDIVGREIVLNRPSKARPRTAEGSLR